MDTVIVVLLILSGACTFMHLLALSFLIDILRKTWRD